MSVKTKLVTTSLLNLDPRLQCRESVPESIIKEYEEGWKDKVAFPPVQVFEVDGELFVTDGFCRVMAAANIGKSKIPAAITKGTFSDAVRAACGANYAHGLRRTNADKRKAALIAIAQFPDETTRALAEMCGVSHAYIGNLREGEKKIEKLIDQAAAGEVPDLETEPQPKKPKPQTKVQIGYGEVPVSGWKCSDCAGKTQVLTDGGYACSACLLPVGESTVEEDDELENTEEPQAEAEPILETFPSGTDPEPEKMPAVHTAWGRFIRACEAAKCTPVLQAEIVSITKKLRGLQ
jgi:hypothetical protein